MSGPVRWWTEEGHHPVVRVIVVSDGHWCQHFPVDMHRRFVEAGRGKEEVFIMWLWAVVADMTETMNKRRAA